jgi:hypothetical protein
MTSERLSLPVSAILQKGPDGMYHISQAEMATISVDAVAEFLSQKLGLRDNMGDSKKVNT